ncbi:MAG: LamB/YcsF family protein, partial [Mycobacterium sp.]|nr:LamB/YcsF family protein [Mycobacterium sp.]
HVGLPDQLGFGRRRMDVDPDDLCDNALYQIGALAAFVGAEGVTLAHVKPHGALYAMCSASGELAAAVARATAQVDSSLPLLLLNDRSRSAVEAEGVRLVTEGFPDLEYEPDGRLVIESVKSASDPVWVAQRAISLAQGGAITARDGTWLTVGGPTLCLHGDAPNAVAVAQAVRTALADAGIQVAPLRVLIDQAGDNR